MNKPKQPVCACGNTYTKRSAGMCSWCTARKYPAETARRCSNVDCGAILRTKKEYMTECIACMGNVKYRALIRINETNSIMRVGGTRCITCSKFLKTKYAPFIDECVKCSGNYKYMQRVQEYNECHPTKTGIESDDES
jgi:hypothetical protein